MTCYKCKFSTPTFTYDEDGRMIVVCELHSVELPELDNCRCGEDFFASTPKAK
jgi:hypothetical protein